MKFLKRYLLLTTLAIASVFTLNLGFASAEQGAVSKMLQGVQLMNQSTVKIKAEKTIYVDPFMIDQEMHDADIIFITHTHSDHFSPKDLNKIKKGDSIIIIPSEGVEKAKDAGFTNVIAVVPNENYDVQGISFTTVPAYNLDKPFHTKDKNWVGYVITANKVSYYLAGDLDFIPEMKNVKADVFFLPVGGKYTMNAAEAAQAANTIKPSVVVPYHCGDLKGVGTYNDITKFLSLLDKDVVGVALK